MRPNIILVTVDSLRYDHLGYSGYNRKTTPFIDSLAIRGTFHKSAYSHSGATQEAFPTILAGVPPPIDYPQCELGIRRGTSVAIELKKMGYKTAGFNSNPYLTERYGYNVGFDEFHSDFEGRATRAGTLTGIGPLGYVRLLMSNSPPITRGDRLTYQLLEWTSKVNKPFFAWIHYMDTHMPYLPPQEYAIKIGVRKQNRVCCQLTYRKMWSSNRRVRKSMQEGQSTLTPGEISRITDLYDASVRFVDHCVEELVGGLEEQGVLDNTFIIFTADHGELLGEHGVVDHGYLYDSVLHVPLIFFGVGVASKIDANPVSHLHVHDSILNVARGSVDNPTPLRPFASIEKGLISSVIYDDSRSSFSCRTSRWKYIETFDKRMNIMRKELYDLEFDREESNNISESYPEKVETFHAVIARFVDENRIQNQKVIPSTFSSEEEKGIQRRLRELGYD